MEEIFEDTDLNTLLTGMSDSSKFNQLSKTIYALRSKYLARGLKHDQVTQKIMSKIFNTKNPVAVNWFNMKSTIEYHQIRNLCEMDPKTIELALAIKQEVEKMKKKKKHGNKQGKDYSLDEMLDLFQYRLESNINFDITNSSSSSSESPSEISDNFRSPEHSNLSYYDQTIQNFNFDNLNFDGLNYMKEQSNIGKRKCKKGTELEDDIWVEAKGESKKKLKVPYKPPENMEGHRAPLSTFFKNEKIFEPSKRNRENDTGINVEKHKSLKM